MAKKPTSIVDTVSLPSGQTRTVPVTRERTPYTEINPDNLRTPEDMARSLLKLQENGKDATYTVRTDPTVGGEMHHNIALTNGVTANIPHGLGEPYRYWSDWGTRPGSQPFAAVEANANATYPKNKYLLLHAFCNGTYDIKICPK